jgi:uncharacterized repeat protein (TIGR01451 family)
VIDTDLTTSSADENIVSLAGVVVLAPVITKAFPGPTIPLNTDRNLTFTITNPNTITITGVAFSDALPAGMVVSTPSVVAGTCGAGVITAVAGSSNISLSAGTIAAASSCTFSVSIKDTIPGVATNTTSNVTSNEAGSGNQATATLTIVAPPVITKAFGALSIPVGGSTSLTFTITNPNATVTLTTVAFIDTLPTGLTRVLTEWAYRLVRRNGYGSPGYQRRQPSWRDDFADGVVHVQRECHRRIRGYSVQLGDGHLG